MISDINSFFLDTLVIDSSMQDIPSDATLTIRDTSEIFAHMMRLWGAVYHLVLPQTIVMSSLPTSYSHAATGSDKTSGTSLPSHIGAHLQTKTLWHTITSEAYSDMCRMDEQTLSLGLMTLVPNVMKEYIRTQSLVLNNTEANYGYYNIPSMVTRNQRIFEEPGENIMWAWSIVNITKARMEGAQDYRSSCRDKTNSIMTTR